MGFTKLFSEILDSSIWQESKETKLLWITLLAMSNRNGEIHASVPGLANRAGITLEDTENGLHILKSPDKYSRTIDHEGRRIKEIDGGWILLNHAKYKAKLSIEERREYNRQKQAESRARRKKEASQDADYMSKTVSNVSKSQQCQHIADSRLQIADSIKEESSCTASSSEAAAAPRQGAIFAESPSLAESVRFGEMVQPIPIPPAAVEAWHAKNDLNQWDVLRSGRKWSDCLRAWWKAIPPKDQHKWSVSPDKGSGNTNTPDEPRKRKLNAVQRNLVEMGIPPHEWKSKYGVDPVY
jgi:hypothetical protein